MSGRQWRVAVPSHDRPNILVEKTLSTLRSGCIPDTWIDVWIDPSEWREYEAALLDFQFAGRLLPGGSPLREQRKAILHGYEPGTPLVCCDDDIREVVRKDENKTETVEDLRTLFDYAFDQADRFDARLWGLYPATNGMFMKHRTSVGLLHVVGSLYGTYADSDPYLDLVLDEKEDYERSIKHYLRDGRVVRLDGYSPVTAYYKTPGGMQNARTVEAQTDAVRHLLREYRRLVKMNPRRKSGYPEVSLKRLPPHDGEFSQMFGPIMGPNGASEKKGG